MQDPLTTAALDAPMSSKQFVILAKPADNDNGSTLSPLGSRREILAQLASRNTMPEREGDDLLYGPGITIQLPPETDPITQMLISITEEEIAWQVIGRFVRDLSWKLLDPVSGRELNS